MKIGDREVPSSVRETADATSRGQSGKTAGIGLNAHQGTAAEGSSHTGGRAVDRPPADGETVDSPRESLDEEIPRNASQSNPTAKPGDAVPKRAAGNLPTSYVPAAWRTSSRRERVS